MKGATLIVLPLAIGTVIGTTCLVDSITSHPDELPPAVVVPVDTRDTVKWSTDDAAKKIEKKPKDTTVASLLALKRPTDLADDDSTEKYQSLRISPLETTVWRVKATITSIIEREDGDLYLVLQDEKGNTMVSECPDLEECEKSPFYSQIVAVHKALFDEFSPTKEPKTLSQKVTLEGIGFFGRATNKEGAYHNGARLMPLTKVSFS